MGQHTDKLFGWFLITLCISLIRGHGRLLKPPSRASAWRLGFNTPVNYDDNQLYCGGKDRQIKNGGKCGVCGDPYDGAREHEAGGKYATGMITANYEEGQTLDAFLQITATHKGYFEFRLCPNNDPKTPVQQSCLDKYILQTPNGSTRVEERGQIANYTIQLMLPMGLTCSQCLLQWRYNTGNSWGCDGANCCVGCGPQEQFYGCSDIAVVASQAQSPSDVTESEITDNSRNTGRILSANHNGLFLISLVTFFVCALYF